jgi:hypothetical protein
MLLPSTMPDSTLAFPGLPCVIILACLVHLLYQFNQFISHGSQALLIRQKVTVVMGHNGVDELPG